MRHLATVRTIETVARIPEADTLSVATMRGLGWRVVVRNGEFSPGRRVLYLEIDSALPAKDFAEQGKYIEGLDWLHDRCDRSWTVGNSVKFKSARIRTMKLRGVVSQGLILPLSAISSLVPDADTLPDGTDITEPLGVLHYDEIHEKFSRICGKSTPPDCKGPYPSFVPKTDEERIQNMMYLFDEGQSRLWEVTEKYDGSSCTIAWNPNARPEDPLYLCSRNLELRVDRPSTWTAVLIDRLHLPDTLRALYEGTTGYESLACYKGRPLALQGELVGPGINSNRDLYEEPEWRLFRIWDINSAHFILPPMRRALAACLGIPHVKVIDPAKDVFGDLANLDSMLSYVSGKTDRGNEREGMVFQALDGTDSFKCISNTYLLKQKD